MRITDYTGNEIILYIVNNNVYIPHCETGYEVYIKHFTACFMDIPVAWRKIENGITSTGTAYLTDDKIIISTSVRINCDPKREKLIPIENNTFLLQAKSDSDLNSVVEIIRNNRKYESIQQVRVRKANFQHYDGIRKNIERTEELISITIDIQTYYYT